MRSKDIIIHEFTAQSLTSLTIDFFGIILLGPLLDLFGTTVLRHICFGFCHGRVVTELSATVTAVGEDSTHFFEDKQI